MADILVPDLSHIAVCPWADSADARAMIERAHGIAGVLTDVESIVPYGHGTVRKDRNGLLVPSAFGSRIRSRDGSSLDIGLGRTREARPTTDDLILRWHPTNGPRLAIDIRMPIGTEPTRPGVNEILDLRDGLQRLGTAILAATDDPSSASGMIGTQQKRIGDAVATLLAHDHRDLSRPFVQIVAAYPGIGAEILIKANGAERMILDEATRARIETLLSPCMTLHLVTHGGDGGKTYRSHPHGTSSPLPAHAPDPVMTMRLISELGLTDLPRIIRS